MVLRAEGLRMISRPSLRPYAPKRLEDEATKAVVFAPDSGFLRWILHPRIIVGAQKERTTRGVGEKGDSEKAPAPSPILWSYSIPY